MWRDELELEVFDEITSHYMTNECQLWITSYEPSSGGPERRVTLRAYEPMLVSGRLADHVTIDFFSIGDLSDFSKLLAWAISSPVDGRHFFNIRDPEAQDPRARFIGEDDALEVIASHVEPGLRYGDRFDAFLQLRHTDEGKAELEKWLASSDDSELAKFVDKFMSQANYGDSEEG